MAILVGFASQENEAGRNDGDAAHPPDYALYVRRKVKVPCNEVYATVS